MIKIIEESSWDLLKIRCPKCNAVLEFNPTEDESIEFQDDVLSAALDYGTLETRNIHCPFCKNKVPTYLHFTPYLSYRPYYTQTNIFTFTNNEDKKTRGNWST